MAQAQPLRSGWWRIPVAVLIASAVAVAAILLAKSQGGAPDPATAVTWEAACPDGLSGDFKCFERHYQTVVNSQSVEAAFTDIKDAYERSPYVKGNCHQLVHVIGRAAGLLFGDVAQAYERGNEFCWSGYYHGVMEAILAKIGYQNVKTQLNTICAGVGATERYSFAHYNCAHGLGHGVMLVSQHELFDALTTCDSLGDGWERESCYGGVFMENILAEINVRPGDSLEDKRRDSRLSWNFILPEQWVQAGMLTVVRTPPVVTARGKLLAFRTLHTR